MDYPVHQAADADNKTPELKRCLTTFDLICFGIGAIIGAGIFILTGIAAATKAGPAVVFSYIAASLACLFTALSYAELSSSIQGCGSAYSYAYAGFGRFIAWIIGWDLLLEYAVATSAVAIGWSAYVDSALRSMGIHLPSALLKGPLEGGVLNLPAACIVLILIGILAIGVHHSSRLNKLMVIIKLFVIGLFISIAIFHVHPANWHPFMPFGWSGVMQGAAIIFFAFIGFDAVATAAEEAINPQRDLPIGIIGSLLICTLIYVAVSGLLCGIIPYTKLNVSSPVADAIIYMGYPLVAGLVAVGAIAGLTSVMLVMFFGLTRIILAMSRDSLLPPRIAIVHPHTQTPIRIIVFCGTLIALIAGFVPMGDVAELVNIGTLAAFAIVCAGVVILRFTKPELPRPFKLPFVFLIPLLGIISCVYLMLHLPGITWLRFVIWLVIGLVIYGIYGRLHKSA